MQRCSIPSWLAPNATWSSRGPISKTFCYGCIGTMIGSTTCCPIDGLLRILKRNWTIVWKKNDARQRRQKPVAMGAVSPIALSEIHRANALPRNSKGMSAPNAFV